MTSLSELKDTVQRLADEGLTRSKRGQWTLAQLCDHLAKTMVGSCPGGDLGPRVMPRWLGAVIKRLIVWTRYMPSGVSAPPSFVPDGAVSTDEAITRLVSAVDAFQALAEQPGVQMTASPAFGPMTYNDWRRIHLIHANHHLKHFTGGAY